MKEKSRMDGRDRTLEIKGDRNDQGHLRFCKRERLWKDQDHSKCMNLRGPWQEGLATTDNQSGCETCRVFSLYYLADVVTPRRKLHSCMRSTSLQGGTPKSVRVKALCFFSFIFVLRQCVIDGGLAPSLPWPSSADYIECLHALCIATSGAR